MLDQRALRKIFDEQQRERKNEDHQRMPHRGPRIRHHAGDNSCNDDE